MSFSNLGIANPSNAVATVEAQKDISNSAEGQQRMAGRHAGTGEGVRAVTAQRNDMLDLAEEMGMAKAGRAKVDLDKIKVRKGAGTDLDALGRISEYLDRLPNLPKDQKLRDLVQRFAGFEESFRRGGEGGLPTPEDLARALAEFDGDVSHRFAALEAVAADAAARGAPAAYLHALNEMRREMRRPETAQAIVAGFHAAPTAARLAERTGGSDADFRDAYRMMLRENASPAAILAKLRSFSLTENLEAVIDGFIRVAGEDMASFGPSADPAHLAGVLRELSVLKQMRTVLDLAGETLSNAARIFPGSEGWPTPADMAARILDFAGQAVPSLGKATELLAGFAEDPPDLRAIMLNHVRSMHDAVPRGLMPPDPQVAQQKAVLATLGDREVDAEEARYSD